MNKIANNLNYLLPKLNAVTKEIANLLEINNIPYAVIGGISLGQYTSSPRNTIDLDILTTPQVKRLFPNSLPIYLNNCEGIQIDYKNIGIEFLFPTDDESLFLFNECKNVEGVNIASLNALIYLKLKAQRTKDSTDLIEILKNIPKENRDNIISWFKNLKHLNIPENINDFIEDIKSLSTIADLEKEHNKNATRQYRMYLLSKLS